MRRRTVRICFDSFHFKVYIKVYLTCMLFMSVDVDELEVSLQNLEATVAPMRKELKRDFKTIPESPQAPLTPTRKHAAEELRYQARAQLGLGFHILRHFRYTLKNKVRLLWVLY